MNKHQQKISNLCSRNSIKRYILKNKIIEYRCSECNIVDQYNNKPIILHLDHINGINNDNRLENLRFLCPNCHSQSPTYCGKNIGKVTKICDCGKSKYYYASRCKDCDSTFRLKNSPKKIEWPSIDYLYEMIEEIGFEELARRLNISSNAIRKHLRKRKGTYSTD